MIGTEFLSGIGAAGFALGSYLFFKFWKLSGDRLFLRFSVAFSLLSTERVVLLIVGGTNQPIRNELTEANSWVYLIRLAAFVTILVAIVQKNREAARRSART